MPQELDSGFGGLLDREDKATYRHLSSSITPDSTNYSPPIF